MSKVQPVDHKMMLLLSSHDSSIKHYMLKGMATAIQENLPIFSLQEPFRKSKVQCNFKETVSCFPQVQLKTSTYAYAQA